MPKKDLEILITILQEGILKANSDDKREHKVRLIHALMTYEREYLTRFGIMYEPKSI